METKLTRAPAELPAPSTQAAQQALADKPTRSRSAGFEPIYRVLQAGHDQRCARDEAFRALSRAHHETLHRLALAGEFKRAEQGQRFARLAPVCALVAAKLGQPPAFCTLLAQAAPLHDIGMVGLPEALIRARRRLDAEERQLLREHVEIGTEILGGSDIPVLRMAAEIALHHHERWDGKGYPYGLAGEEIPLAARIVAVVDYFDRLTHPDKDYRPALPHARALIRLWRGSGRLFDPGVVECLLWEAERVASLVAHVDGQLIESDSYDWEGDWWMVF